MGVSQLDAKISNIIDESAGFVIQDIQEQTWPIYVEKRLWDRFVVFVIYAK